MSKSETNNKDNFHISVLARRKMFSFQSEQEWVNKAGSWFRCCGVPRGHYICIDSAGNVCQKGKEFMRATKENTYPITVYELVI